VLQTIPFDEFWGGWKWYLVLYGCFSGTLFLLQLMLRREVCFVMFSMMIASRLWECHEKPDCMWFGLIKDAIMHSMNFSLCGTARTASAYE
jgi:D-alanyl-lipoteichoic acid acyltransferase DltB (MBOAT superfamily)